MEKRTVDGIETTYVYDPNARLTRLLMKTTDDVTTKYVYGLGLIGEETDGEFKTYHYDYRGSTVAITEDGGNITDTFEYDTYGKLLSHDGSTETPFCYNGRDGVMTEPNGLYYMRNRFYSPDLKRFINPDLIAGDITNAITLNRYAYANNNPISLVDPLGLSAERGTIRFGGYDYAIYVPNHLDDSTHHAEWETVAIHPASSVDFDWGTFLKNLLFDDAGSLKKGLEQGASKEDMMKLGAMALLYGFVNATYNATDNITIDFKFQKRGDQRRVIIGLGSATMRDFYDRYAGTTQALISGRSIYQNAINHLYEELTGDDINMLYERANIYTTFDTRHKDDPYYAYLSLDSSGSLLLHPITYSNDAITLVKETCIMGFVVDATFTNVTLPFDNPSVAPKNISKHFFKELEQNEQFR